VEDEKLEEKILRKVFIWLVASGAIVGGVSGTGILRVDKFGESDYQLESLKLENKCKEYTDERFEEHFRVIPPLCTRVRIKNIESFLSDKYPEFEAPCEEF
jgi:hypothetical protein